MRIDEKYRPDTFDDVIGQDKIIALLKRLEYNGKHGIDGMNGFGGRAFYLTGGSGTGKSTIATIMAASIASRFTTFETTGRELTQSDLKKYADMWRKGPALTGDGWALIVNESHGLSRPVIEVLLNILETLPDCVTIIFTTTHEGHDLFEEQVDSGPFASRCLSLRLASRGLCEPFAAQAKKVAGLEGLDGKPLEDYIKLMKQCRNNLRQAYREIESGTMQA